MLIDVNTASPDSLKVNRNFLDHENMYVKVPILRPSIFLSLTLILYVISNNFDFKSSKKKEKKKI